VKFLFTIIIVYIIKQENSNVNIDTNTNDMVLDTLIQTKNINEKGNKMILIDMIILYLF
jgi:hypothetical protein